MHGAERDIRTLYTSRSLQQLKLLLRFIVSLNPSSIYSAKLVNNKKYITHRNSVSRDFR